MPYIPHISSNWNSRVRQSHQNRKLLHSHFIQVHISLGYGHEMYINRILFIFFQIPTAVFRGGCSCWRRVWASPPSRTAWAGARETLLQRSGHVGQEQGEGRTHQIKKQRSPCSQGRGQYNTVHTIFYHSVIFYCSVHTVRNSGSNKLNCTEKILVLLKLLGKRSFKWGITWWGLTTHKANMGRGVGKTFVLLT